MGGNRSFSSMGFGRNDGALIVNLKNLRVLEYGEQTQLLMYGGPVMISEAAGFMWENYQRALPHGRCPDVGMTGVAASEFGTMSRTSGTVLDNVAGVRVALANGTIVNADASENADIYWAVRGAASSIGVVLRFKLRTLEHPSQTVFNYTIRFNKKYTATQQDNVAALLGTQTWAQSADNNDLLSIRFGISTNSQLQGFFYGTTQEYEKVTESLMSYLPSNMTISSTQASFWNSEDYATPGIRSKSITPRRYFYITSVTIPGSAPLANSTAWALFSATAYGPQPPDASASGFVDIWCGGYTKAVRPGDSAWKHDDNLLLVRWDIRTSKPEVPFAQSTLDDVHDRFYYVFVNAYKTATGGTPGGFTTYRDEKWDINQTAEYLYGDNWARLREIKTAVDPNELFNTDPQDIPALPS
jgi:FAD/FMN-containing dehydrogenase